MSAVEEIFSLNFPQNSYFPDGHDASQGASYLEPRGHGNWVSCPAASLHAGCQVFGRLAPVGFPYSRSGWHICEATGQNIISQGCSWHRCEFLSALTGTWLGRHLLQCPSQFSLHRHQQTKAVGCWIVARTVGCSEAARRKKTWADLQKTQVYFFSNTETMPCLCLCVLMSVVLYINMAANVLIEQV